MSKKKIIGIILICIFSFSAFVCGGIFAHQYHESRTRADSFNDLSGLINVVEPVTPSEDSSEEELTEETIDPEILEAQLAQEKYGRLFEQNQDFIGWINIPDTNIDYPVMQTPSNPDFYLKHGFDKEYSDYGVPYIEESCALGISNNIVIYGHHMKDGSMFNDLCGYTEKAFWEAHPTIYFDTVSKFGTYQVVAVFKFDTNNETFKYNECVTMNEEQFAEFMVNVHARELYDTGVDAEYGDQLLTLSTCEYSYKNGRFVVVAKRVN